MDRRYETQQRFAAHAAMVATREPSICRMWRRTSERALSAQMENSGTAITLRPTKINGTDMLDMWVIFMDISAGQGGLSSVEVEARRGCCRSMLDSVC